MTDEKPSIVIIGAGPAGLTAGYSLLKSGFPCKVTILEELETVGGISRTVCHNGNRMDIGGHRFFTKDPEVNALWNDKIKSLGLMFDGVLKKYTPAPQEQEGAE